MDWMRRGNCHETDTEAMFVKGAAQHEAAKACKRCPVIATCLAHALDNGEEYGVWGGQTERQRRAMLKKHPNVTRWADVFGRDESAA